MKMRFNLVEERRKASAIVLANIFHALKVPESHIALVTLEDVADGYFLLPQLDVFRPSYTTENKSLVIKTYLGNAAIHFRSARGEKFRGKLAALIDEVADPIYDRPVWVDQAGEPMSLNEFLPAPQILDAAYSAYRGEYSSSRLNSFVEQSLSDLGDRLPQLPGLV
jgi:hypothetical protein